MNERKLPEVPENLGIVMESEWAEWEDIRINTTKAIYKNKVNLEIQEAILKLAKKRLKDEKEKLK